MKAQALIAALASNPARRQPLWATLNWQSLCGHGDAATLTLSSSATVKSDSPSGPVSA